MKQLLWLSQESTIEDRLCTSFFSLGRTSLVPDLHSATTVSNPIILKSEVLQGLKLSSSIQSLCSQFDSLVKNHRFKFTSFLQTSICQAVVAKCYDFFFQVFLLQHLVNTSSSQDFVVRVSTMAAAAHAAAVGLRVDAPADAGVTLTTNRVYHAPALL
jgi:hypothetical protein